MCDAFAGKAFKITNGSEFTIGFGTKGADPMGICLQPIDALLGYVASWPLFAQTWNANGTSFSPSSLFATGKSLSYATLKSWFNTPKNFVAIVQHTMEKYVSTVREFWSARYSSDSSGYYDDYNDYNGYKYPAGSYGSDGSVGDAFNFSGSFGWVGYIDFNYSESGSRDSSGDVGYGYYYVGYGSYTSSSRDGGQDLVYVLLERLVAGIGPMLLHVPNGGECTFVGETISVPFDVRKVSAIDTVATAVTMAPSGTTTVSTQSSGAAGASTLSSSMGLAMLSCLASIVL